MTLIVVVFDRDIINVFKTFITIHLMHSNENLLHTANSKICNFWTNFI